MRIPDYINVKEFGAIGDGVADDTLKIQAAIDSVIASPTNARKRIYFPPGTYRTTAPLMIYKWNGTNYEFVSIELYGSDNTAYGPSTSATNIVCTQTDTFALGIQGGKNCIIRGLSITGQFQLYYADQKTWIDDAKDYDTLGDSFACRDSQYSPYSGIVLDPFTPVVPSDGGYPGMTSWYRGAYDVGGTAIEITNCVISGFIVDVMHSPNGVTQNDEIIAVTRCLLGQCKVAFSYGQGQTKSCSINECGASSFVHTVMDNLRYGELSGAPASIDGFTVGGFVYQFFNVDVTSATGFGVKDVFTENLFQVGKLICERAPVSIDSSQFQFLAGHEPQVGSPDHYFDFNNVAVTGTRFGQYDNDFNKRLFVKAANCSFINCSFDLPPVIADVFDIGTKIFPTFINCDYGIQGSYALGVGSTSWLSDFAYQPKAALYGNFKLLVNQSAFGVDEIEYNETSFQRSLYVGASTLTVNETLRTATIVLSDPWFSHIAVDDVLYALVGGGLVPTFLGRVESLDSGTTTVTLHNVPASLSTGAFTNIFVNFFRTVGHPFIGDAAFASKTITNVVAPYGYPAAGDRIESKFFGRLGYEADKLGAYVVSVNAGAQTVTMNVVAESDVIQGNFFSGKPKFKVKKYSDITADAGHIVFKGAEVFYDAVSASGSYYTVKKYIVERAGKISGTPQAVWYEVVDVRITSGVAEYFDKATQTWIGLADKLAVPTYADEAAAVIGTLTTGQVYQTATGELRIKL